MLSAIAHGKTEQRATIAAAVLPASRGLDENRVRLYYDLVFNSLNEAARRALEAMMKGYDCQSDFAKKYVAQGRSEGLAEGRTEDLIAGTPAVRSALRVTLPLPTPSALPSPAPAPPPASAPAP